MYISNMNGTINNLQLMFKRLLLNLFYEIANKFRKRICQSKQSWNKIVKCYVQSTKEGSKNKQQCCKVQ